MTISTQTFPRSGSSTYAERLRLRFAELKGESLAIAELASSLRRLPSVTKVETSVVTGSILLTYDADRHAETAFWPALRAMLAQHGLPSRERGAAHHGGTATPAVDGIAERIIGSVVEKLVERSALALVAAFI
jgi:hypothetical protein